MSRTTVERTAYFTITCFSPADSYYRFNPEELADMQDGIFQIFSRGYLEVGDRFMKALSSVGGMESDRAYIDLQIEYFDNRTEEEAQEPLIASVKTRIQEE